MKKNTKIKKSNSNNSRIKNFTEYYKLTEKEAKYTSKLIEQYLPHSYSKKVIALALKKNITVSSQSVRHIKGGNYKNSEIFNIIIEYAVSIKENEMLIQKNIKKLIF